MFRPKANYGPSAGGRCEPVNSLSLRHGIKSFAWLETSGRGRSTTAVGVGPKQAIVATARWGRFSPQCDIDGQRRTYNARRLSPGHGE